MIMKKIFTFIAAMLVAFAASAATINIDNTTPDALRLALNDADDGDEIVMAAGTYVESNGDYIAFAGKHVTVKAADGAEVLIQPQVPITISEGGCAHFVGVKFDVSRLTELATWYEHLMYASDATSNSIVLEGCELYNFNMNKSMLYCNASNTLASVTINNCYFHNIMKSVLFNENTTGAINISITNSTFANISTNTESYWAGVIDSRAGTGSLVVDHCTFYNVIPMNTDYAAVGTNKVTVSGSRVDNSIFVLPTSQDGVRAVRGVSAANNCLTFNYIKDGGGIYSTVTQTDCKKNVDPLFVDAANGDYTLSLGEGGNNSPALRAGVNGECLGDPRWWPTFNVRGTMNGWSATDDQMEWAEANHIYYKQIDLAAGSYEFKINHGAWLADWGPANIAGGLGDVALSNVNDNIGMTTDGRPIIVYFDLAHNVVWVDYLYPKVELLGNFTNWATNPLVMLNDINNEYCMAQAEFDNPGIYEYRIRINDASNWKGNTGVMDRANCTGWDMDADHNCGIKIDIPGLYEFKYDFASEQMSVTYAESFTRVNNDGHYQTLCAPFNASITNAAVYEVTAAGASGVTINEVDASMLAAGKSYIVKPTDDMVITKVGDGVVSDPIFPISQGTGLYGVLSESYTYVYNDEPTWKNIFVLQDDDMFHQVIAGGSATITSTRAYLHIAGDELVPNLSAPGIRIIENATNIENIEGNETAVKFIENGKLFIKKNGVVYDAVGAVVK